jgi:AraC-like DNA-binding protein
MLKPKTRAIDPAERPPSFFSPQVARARRFYLALSPPSGTPLAVVCGGFERCSPDYVIRREDFPYLAVEFVLQGTGELKLAGRSYPLHAGLLFCYGPGVAHEITTDQDDLLAKYFVNFTGRNALNLLHSGEVMPGKVVQVFSSEELAGVFDQIIHNGLKATRQSPAICARLLEVLILKLSETSAPAAGVESKAFATYQHCRQHLEENFLRLRTLEEAAHECHVNAAHLCRLFRRFDHQSPYQLLMRLKMNRAGELLHQPTALVKQVAEEVGFGDPFHFSRAFKNVFGVSPDAFRKLR